MRRNSGASDDDRAPREIRRIGDIVSHLLARRGYARVMAQEALSDVWQQVSGKWASVSRAGNFRRGQLEVIVKSSLVVQELMFQKTTLVRKLQQLAPNENIRDIKFTVGPIE